MEKTAVCVALIIGILNIRKPLEAKRLFTCGKSTIDMFMSSLDKVSIQQVIGSNSQNTKLGDQLIRQLLNSAIAIYRDLSVSRIRDRYLAIFLKLVQQLKNICEKPNT